MLPKSPYFDQVASSCGLYLTLKEKFETIVHSSTPMLVEFNRLIGVDKVVSEIANKNVIIKLTNYPASQIERVLYDTDGVNDLALTVIPKQGVPAPRPENFTFASSGVTVDTVILIGGSNDSHFPSLASSELANVKIIHIGRESVAINGREVMSLARPGSSLAEVVTSILKESEMEISADSATNLFSGLMEGSRNFTDAGVTAETFKVASLLLEQGARRTQAVARPTTPGANPGNPATQPAQATGPAPKSWLEPKIYKGTSVN